MVHGEGHEHTATTHEGVRNPVIERGKALALDLAHEVDPEVQVRFSTYRWHGDDVLDIVLDLRGVEHHLEVTAGRMKLILRDPGMLEHDMLGSVTDMRRHAAHGHAAPGGRVEHGPAEPGATNEAGVETAMGAPVSSGPGGYGPGAARAGSTVRPRGASPDGSDADHAAPVSEVVEPGDSFIIEPGTPPAAEPGDGTVRVRGVDGDQDTTFTAAPAARAAGVPLGGSTPVETVELRSNSDLASAHAVHDRDQPETGHEPVPDTVVPPVRPEDRHALDRLTAIARHIVAELDPEATVAFEEYLWHGEPTLDMTIALHGHTHHFEVGASRAHLLVRDHDMLHHDLEGVIRDLQREPAHQS